jgi:hypothetical protein
MALPAVAGPCGRAPTEAAVLRACGGVEHWLGERASLNDAVGERAVDGAVDAPRVGLVFSDAAEPILGGAT